MNSLLLIALAAGAAAPDQGAAARLTNSSSCGKNFMSSTYSGSQTVIRNSGSQGDPATVIRRGPQGEIVLEQSGPCNDAAITQTGADNRSTVRQSGSGNRVTVRQGPYPEGRP